MPCRPASLVRASRLTACVFALLASAALAKPAAAQEWTRFRGPNGTGISDAKTIPATWTDNDYAWKIELPGIGHSSPVLWGDKLFLTSAIEGSAERVILCIDSDDGSIIWERRLPFTMHKKHVMNSFASSTPAVDEERVYVAFTNPEAYTLMALDHEGRDVWQVDLGAYTAQHSGGTSPIVVGEMVVIGNEQDGESFLRAVDRRTGQTLWQTPRKTAVVAYSTPCLYENGGETELIFNSEAHGISAVDPTNGKTKWELAVFDKRSVSSPVFADGLVFGSCGSGAGGNYVAAVRPGESPELVEKITQQAPYVPTPIVKDGRIYLWADGGVATCVDLSNWNVLWRERIGGNYSGSPVCVDDKIYCIDMDGNVVVIAAKDEFEKLGSVPLGESSRSTPAVANGKMFLRTYSHLFAITGKTGV